MRKDGDETGVVRWSRGEISISLLAGKEDSLRRRPRATICLNPAAACAVYSSSPKAKHFDPKSGVGYFQHNAAHVFVGEPIVAGELKVVQGHHVEEEGITTPTCEEAVVASFGYPCLPVHRDRRSFDDYLVAVVGSGGSCALDATQRCGLRPVCEWREAYAVCNIGNIAAVRVNLDLV
jgi:hypothetical protein